MKTPYEIMNIKKPTLKYFHVFGARCFVLKDGDDHLGKFEAKAFEAIFVGYSRRSYRVYIIDKHQVKESVNVTFDDTKLPSIQKEDPSESLKFDNLSDDPPSDGEDEPEVVTGDNNANGDAGGNIDNDGDTTITGEESPSQSDNNSGGGNEGSTSHTQHQNEDQGESSRSNLPR